MNLADKLVQSLFGDKSGIFQQPEREKVKVGKVSPETLQKFKAWKKDKSNLEHEMKLEKLRIMKALEDMFDDREDEIAERKAALWYEIEDELGLPHDCELSMNAKNGEVSRYVDEDED